MAVYRSGISTKQKIEIASRKLFYQKGIDCTTYAQIAKKADVDISSIVYHYKGFDNLISEIYKKLITERRAFVRARLAQLFPEEELSELSLFGIEYRVAFKLYAKDPKYFRFFRDAYFKVVHKIFETASMEMYNKELNLNYSAVDKIYHQAYIGSYQFIIPDFIIDGDYDISTDEAVDFYIRQTFTAFNQSEEKTQSHIDICKKYAHQIEVFCDSQMNLK